MSADSHVACPKCHPDLVGMGGCTGNNADELGYSNDARENIEYYIRNGNEVFFEYRVDCWECGWHSTVRLTGPLTGL